MTELHDILLDVRRVKGWLIATAFLTSVLLAITLGYVAGLHRGLSRVERDLSWQIDKTAQIKAAYEEQKKDLYTLDQRFTETEIQRRLTLILKEKDNE